MWRKLDLQFNFDLDNEISPMSGYLEKGYLSWTLFTWAGLMALSQVKMLPAMGDPCFILIFYNRRVLKYPTWYLNK